MQSLSLLVLVGALAGVSGSDSGLFNWMTLGDWGGASISAQDKQNVYAVATQMATTASASDPAFIVNTGDNFYWCGIQNATDPQITTDFELPYAAPSLQDLQWYSILGNHEYGYNSQAEIDYAMINDRWIMPSRYYTRRVLASDGNTTVTAGAPHITFIFLDTSPCIRGYRQDNPANWDPCSTMFPTCSPGATDDDFEGPCNFHANILDQSCDDQYTWFTEQLAQVPQDDWLVVVGHHPADEINVRDFLQPLLARGFSLYLNGHAHTLTQYTINNTGAYVTSGAGSLVDTPDQASGGTAAKVRGESDIAADGSTTTTTATTRSLTREEEADQADIEATGGVHKGTYSYQTVFNLKVAGFTTHTFNADWSELTTEFVGYDGEIVHSFVSTQDGTLKA